MAKTKPTCACIFLLVLIFSLEVIFTESRHLNTEKNKPECECHDGVGYREIRPTIPGHSPGIGHSDQKRSVDPHV
uniref:Transmembrane protein n=1 Tax=Nelumbo nucifera TaxID=4432 RepID=A0A822XQN0_NELNU|nr:TPA_asm: hypothetical protein HUJ06_023805 [Nelumbo nucifera]